MTTNNNNNSSVIKGTFELVKINHDTGAITNLGKFNNTVIRQNLTELSGWLHASLYKDVASENLAFFETRSDEEKIQYPTIYHWYLRNDVYVQAKQKYPGLTDEMLINEMKTVGTRITEYFTESPTYAPGSSSVIVSMNYKGLPKTITIDTNTGLATKIEAFSGTINNLVPPDKYTSVAFFSKFASILPRVRTPNDGYTTYDSIRNAGIINPYTVTKIDDDQHIFKLDVLYTMTFKGPFSAKYIGLHRKPDFTTDTCSDHPLLTFARLYADKNGNPIEVTVAENESLDVYYSLHFEVTFNKIVKQAMVNSVPYNVTFNVYEPEKWKKGSTNSQDNVFIMSAFYDNNTVRREWPIEWPNEVECLGPSTNGIQPSRAHAISSYSPLKSVSKTLSTEFCNFYPEDQEDSSTSQFYKVRRSNGTHVPWSPNQGQENLVESLIFSRERFYFYDDYASEGRGEFYGPAWKVTFDPPLLKNNTIDIKGMTLPTIDWTRE